MSGSNSSDRGWPLGATAAEPLQLSVHSMPAPSLADGGAAAPPQRAARGRLKMLGVLLVCAAPVIASYFTYFVIRPEGRSNYAALVEPKPLPAALPLATLDGQAVDPASLKNQWLLLVVGGGACGADCEQRLYLQRQLREMTGRERERIDKLWLVTDDAPLPPALRQALAQAPVTRVLRVDRAALAQWLAPEPGHALEDHLYVVDPLGNWMLRAPARPEPAKLKRDVERLLRASASWDKAGR